MANMAFITHKHTACGTERDSLTVKFAGSAYLTHLKDGICSSAPAVVVVYEAVDRHIGVEIIDTVRSQLCDLPTERADHMVKVLVG